MKHYSKYIDPYMQRILEHEVEHCKEQEQMILNNVIPAIERDDVYIDEQKIEEGLSLQKYFPYQLIEWEVFLFALIVGVKFQDTDDIYFNDIRILVGRGSGKNGFVSFLCFYFLSPYYGIRNYDIDLLANSEEQAKRSFTDVYNVITDNQNKEYIKVLKSHYYATKVEIVGKVTKSTLKFNTSSKRGKDSKRSGCIILDEKHEYVDDTNMNTLASGLGKVIHGRIITITTDGHVRGGVLDVEKEQNKEILSKYNPDNQTLVFWCRIEKQEEWDDIEKLVKAIPSLNDFPSLKRMIKKEITDMPFKQNYYPEFMAKRCNFPIGNKDLEVALWEDILKTNKEVIDLRGFDCVGGIDYAKTNDFVGCVLVFKVEGKYYAIQQTFVCKKSRDLPGIKAPLHDWEKKGDLIFVDDVDINPVLIAEWFYEMGSKYNIKKIAIDNFRYTLLNSALKEIGFDAFERKNVIRIRPSDLMKVQPVINSAFINHNIIWGDLPIMRWYTNNTKLVQNGVNYEYGKIEANYRKTDGFMAFAAAMTLADNEIKPKPKVSNIPTLVF
ncbi:terminase large subunit domain-containing protein [Anaerosacchariphilus polymeriproducens]|uniref:Terminase large subunit n=1 Tax=Anaerosacchariphilus polymeriproducens TaxID=1812858 RepID=A0A371ARJ8_9FIRM|nr:terminase large subunit [Anaerosacchariphilus polymeriproducens]RDU22201.1 terminase large subunit [Anaerosacchariphilus polymeriproducens]